MMLLTFDVVVIPLRVFDISESVTLEVMFWVAHIYWNMAILVSFATGYEVEGILVMDLNKTIRNYAFCGWTSYFRHFTLIPKAIELGTIIIWPLPALEKSITDTLGMCGPAVTSSRNRNRWRIHRAVRRAESRLFMGMDQSTSKAILPKF